MVLVLANNNRGTIHVSSKYKSRLHRKSRLYTGSPAHLSSIILTGGVVYLLLMYIYIYI